MVPEEVLLKYYDSVRQFTYWMVRNDDVANDIVQETYYSALRYVRKHGLERDPGAWLRKIAYNKVRSLWRSRHQRGLSHVVDPNNVVYAGKGVLDGVVESEQAELVRDAVADLKPKYGNLISGFYFDDKSCRDLARECRSDPTTVRVGLHRGRNLLAVKLRGLNAE